ncbi:MAG: hypothetical protein WC789_11130 [Lentisphaeria bacterium]|jgi:V/A-type H+-transporting ATPase subunit I
MAQVTLVCLAADRQAAVERLRELGSMHVLAVRPPESEELAALQAEHGRLARIVAVLTALKGHPAKADAAGGLPAGEVADAVLAFLDTVAQVEAEIVRLQRNRQLLAPWGDFDATLLERLAQAGLQVRLCAYPETQPPALPAGAALQPLGVRGGLAYALALAKPGVALDALPLAPLPELTAAAEIARREAAAQARLAGLRAELVAMKPAVPRIQRELHRLEGEIQFCQARDGMGDHGALVHLEGYVPAAETDALLVAARTHGWALRTVAPAEDDPHVPTKLKLARWAQPVRVILDIIGVMPGYREVDISAWFLLFFSIFFAMLIGDAVYGLLLLLALVAVKLKFPALPRRYLGLMAILGVTTTAWGVMSGSYLGMDIANPPLKVAWLAEPRHVQKLCFLLGAIHLTLAHFWNALLAKPRLKALGQLGWAGILWGNYFLACQMILNEPAPPFLLWLYGGGMAGVVLFSEFQRNPFKTVGLGLGALLMGIVNSFVDVVSYVRLFAVGMAGLAIEQSVLNMAHTLPLPPGLLHLAGALILVAGHGLNMALCALGVLVHGVRLNVLEFAGHLGLTFSGVPYKPLKPLEPGS